MSAPGFGRLRLDLKLIENESSITFYDGISLTQYYDLAKRWSEMLSIIHREVSKYVNDDSLCFDGEDSNLFPILCNLTGNYYIDKVAYTKYLNPIGFQIMISTILTERLSTGEDDYLGLEVTLFTKSINANFEVWGVDSSVV
ncbi:hypothetical protein DCC85_09945 [Paenibacillus sp. CAA11]|uniref:hypothetical protein n=1 Tax=Paenibacillus sp. CAA11 TaxID=1532905 RepID=UPI000D3DC351|nr:hypothetical protein [Paenibacillus sp. CAA11]AWB44515.1 hypothetical protein DCC85_09945 [Paenibacillus sp. CAA11]